MYWKNRIELGKEIVDDSGFEATSTFLYTFAFANKISIKQQEHYNANQLGLKPEVAFEVREETYQGQTRVKYNGKEYKLIRTFDNFKNGTIELYLTSELGVNEHE